MQAIAGPISKAHAARTCQPSVTLEKAASPIDPKTAPVKKTHREPRTSHKVPTMGARTPETTTPSPKAPLKSARPNSPAAASSPSRTLKA